MKGTHAADVEYLCSMAVMREHEKNFVCPMVRLLEFLILERALCKEDKNFRLTIVALCKRKRHLEFFLRNMIRTGCNPFLCPFNNVKQRRGSTARRLCGNPQRPQQQTAADE